MFFELPKEIIDYIYLFDSTYHEVFRNVLRDLIPYNVYEKENYILIVKKDETIAHSTNSITKPVYICTHYLENYNNMKSIIQQNDLRLTRKFNHLIQTFIDEYDLDTFPFL